MRKTASKGLGVAKLRNSEMMELMVDVVELMRCDSNLIRPVE